MGSIDTFRTGTDSPVNADSSTEKFAHSREHRVGGNPVTLGEQGHVASHHVAAGDAYLRPVPNDERPGGRQVAQRGQRPFGSVLLIDRNRDDNDDETHQHDAVERLGHEEVHQAGAEE